MPKRFFSCNRILCEDDDDLVKREDVQNGNFYPFMTAPIKKINRPIKIFDFFLLLVLSFI